MLPHMENGKWKMEHGKSSPVYSETPSPLAGGRLFSAARKGHVFSAPSPTTPRPLFASKREFCSRFLGGSVVVKSDIFGLPPGSRIGQSQAALSPTAWTNWSKAVTTRW